MSGLCLLWAAVKKRFVKRTNRALTVDKNFKFASSGRFMGKCFVAVNRMEQAASISRTGCITMFLRLKQACTFRWADYQGCFQSLVDIPRGQELSTRFISAPPIGDFIHSFWRDIINLFGCECALFVSSWTIVEKWFTRPHKVHIGRERRDCRIDSSSHSYQGSCFSRSRRVDTESSSQWGPFVSSMDTTLLSMGHGLGLDWPGDAVSISIHSSRFLFKARICLGLSIKESRIVASWIHAPTLFMGRAIQLPFDLKRLYWHKACYFLAPYSFGVQDHSTFTNGNERCMFEFHHGSHHCYNPIDQPLLSRLLMSALLSCKFGFPCLQDSRSEHCSNASGESVLQMSLFSIAEYLEANQFLYRDHVRSKR